MEQFNKLKSEQILLSFGRPQETNPTPSGELLSSLRDFRTPRQETKSNELRQQHHNSSTAGTVIHRPRKWQTKQAHPSMHVSAVIPPWIGFTLHGNGSELQGLHWSWTVTQEGSMTSVTCISAYSTRPSASLYCSNNRSTDVIQSANGFKVKRSVCKLVDHKYIYFDTAKYQTPWIQKSNQLQPKLDSPQEVFCLKKFPPPRQSEFQLYCASHNLNEAAVI